MQLPRPSASQRPSIDTPHGPKLPWERENLPFLEKEISPFSWRLDSRSDAPGDLGVPGLCPQLSFPLGAPLIPLFSSKKIDSPRSRDCQVCKKGRVQKSGQKLCTMCGPSYWLDVSKVKTVLSSKKQTTVIGSSASRARCPALLLYALWYVRIGLLCAAR